MKGQDYPELKDSYILFICKEDPFKDDDSKVFGLPCYTFRNICEENASVKLNDKSIKVIYNASAYEKEEDEEFRSDYAAMNLHDRDIHRAAKREGARETTIENTKNLYKNGVSKEIIAKSLKISLDEVENILKDIDS